MDQLWLCVGFTVFVLVLLALDLGVFHREAHAVRVRRPAPGRASGSRSP